LVESLYSKLNNSGQIQNQRFVDRFGGNGLDERWLLTVLRGTGSGAMADAIDEGFNLLADGGSSFNKTKISFGGNRQYSNTGAVMIGIWRNLEVDDIVSKMALINISTDGANTNFVQTQGAAVFNIVTDDGTTSSSTNGSAYNELVFNLFKIEITPTTGTLIANGILEVTHTTNLPTARLEPTFQVNAQVPVTPRNMRVRYAEAYNT